MSVRWPPARALFVDAVLAIVLGVVCWGFVTNAPLSEIPPDPNVAPGALAYALMAATIGVLLVRNAAPLTALAVSVVAVTAYLAGGYPYLPPIFVAMAIGIYTLAVRWPLRRSIGACAAVLLLIIGGHVVGTGADDTLALLPGWLAFGSAWLLTPWAIGVVVGLRRDTVAREREQEIRKRADEERLRIAREVHDVVGHGLAAINMQAGVALHVLDRRPEQARPALEAIKHTSKQSLDELRGTLAVFRQPGGPESDEDAPTGPAPGLGQLDALVTRMRQSGLEVQVDVTGSVRDGNGARAPTTLPAPVDLAAYRIVQESLTNVARHAQSARAAVQITYEPAELTLDITDSGQARVSDPPYDDHVTGHGIAGMRERATALGGTLEAGPRTQGGFRVRARLPVGENDHD